MEALNRHGKPVNGSRILLLGLAYKADVDDIRESPSLVLIQKLESLGAKVDYNDPYMPVIPVTREHKQLAGRKSEPIAKGYDCLLLATAHSSYEKASLAALGVPIVDCRGFLPAGPNVWRA